jgi:hypothetical protein
VVDQVRCEHLVRSCDVTGVVELQFAKSDPQCGGGGRTQHLACGGYVNEKASATCRIEPRRDKASSSANRRVSTKRPSAIRRSRTTGRSPSATSLN